MKDAEKVLETTKAECLRMIQEARLQESRLAWYYTHMGEIEMATMLGLISGARGVELRREWAEHRPSPEVRGWLKETESCGERYEGNGN